MNMVIGRVSFENPFNACDKRSEKREKWENGDNLATKRLMSAIGALFLVLGSVFALLGLSYVVYWLKPTPSVLPTSIPPFPLHTFWLG